MSDAISRLGAGAGGAAPEWPGEGADWPEAILSFFRDLAEVPMAFLYQGRDDALEGMERASDVVELTMAGGRVRSGVAFRDATLGQACLDIWRVFEAVERPYTHMARFCLGRLALLATAWLDPLADFFEGRSMPAPLCGAGGWPVEFGDDGLSPEAREALGRGDWLAFNRLTLGFRGCPLDVMVLYTAACVSVSAYEDLADLVGLPPLDPIVGGEGASGAYSSDHLSLLLVRAGTWRDAEDRLHWDRLEMGPFRRFVVPVARAQLALAGSIAGDAS